jgi:hypothetical protein
MPTVQDARVYRGADINSDHRLVAASLKLKFKRPSSQGKSERRFNSDCLRDVDVVDNFQSVIGGRFHALLNDTTNISESSEAEWARFSQDVARSAAEVLGYEQPSAYSNSLSLIFIPRAVQRMCCVRKRGVVLR